MTIEDFEILDEGDGPVILCLHGFPQSEAAFDEVARKLVDEGFRVIRFNQRGYTTSTSHGRRWQYTSRRLAQDCIDVLDQVGTSEAIVVGHDLGCLVAWRLAYLAPERVRGLVILGFAHPAALVASLACVKQALLSWYVLVAQSSTLTNALFSPKGVASRMRLFHRLTQSGLSPAKAGRDLDFLSIDQLFLGAIRWYQSLPFDDPVMFFRRCTRPTELVWSRDDAFVTRLSVELTSHWVTSSLYRRTILDRGSHWLLDNSPVSAVEAVKRVADRSP